VVPVLCRFEGIDAVSGRVVSWDEGEDGGELLEGAADAGLAAVDLVPKPK
jgi:hypothetical protein